MSDVSPIKLWVSQRIATNHQSWLMGENIKNNYEKLQGIQETILIFYRKTNCIRNQVRFLHLKFLKRQYNNFPSSKKFTMN